MSARGLRTWMILPAVVLAGCGGERAGTPAVREAGLPRVVVVNLDGGARVALPDVPEGGRPLLVWFWSPY